MTWVLNEAAIPNPTPAGTPSAPALTMVLLGLANHAGKTGQHAFPSVKTLAGYARISERQVQRCLAALVDFGLIEHGNQRIVAAEIEREDRRPVCYNLVMKPQVTRGDISSPRHEEPQVERGDTLSPREERGDTEDPNGVTGETERGDTGVTRTVLEPRDEPRGVPKSGTSPARAETPPPSSEPLPAPEPPPADSGPSPFCERHPDGADHPCGPCADARRAFKAWEAERERAEKARIAADAHARAEAKRQAAAACSLCDDDGYIGTWVCDHVPDRAEVNARGMARVRAVLAKNPAKSQTCDV